MKRILLTGAAGFIGSTLADKILLRGNIVIGIDNLNTQYDPRIKLMNILSARSHPEYSFYEADIRNHQRLTEIFLQEKPDVVVHVAGSTGMKASMLMPEEFYSNNVTGTHSLLESCRRAKCTNIIFISTSSVYGDASLPVDEDDTLPPPANPYVATKHLGESFVRSYTEFCGLNATILRLFTVYGPRQRSEMAIHKFVRLIDCGDTIEIYGDGSAMRDYLYIDDGVDAIIQAIDLPFKFEIFNIGEQKTTTLNELIRLLEKYIGKKTKVKYVPDPAGIPLAFCANIKKARQMLNYEPKIPIEEGLDRFIKWYRENKTNIFIKD